MQKFFIYLLVSCVLSILCSGMFVDKSTSITYSLPTTSRKYPSFSFDVESPFTDSYGYYSLTDSGHSINDYISSIPLGFNKDASTILVKAPYLTYTSEANRYYYGSVTDTKGGSSTLGPYDTWSLQYNDQPYLTSNDIIVKGYHGNTFISNLSFSLSGHNASSGYYLQNLNINVSIPSNITSLELRINRVNYSSSYHEVVTTEVKYKTVTYPDKTVTQAFNRTDYTYNKYTVVEVTLIPPSGYSFYRLGGTIVSGISALDVLDSNLSSGWIQFKVTYATGGWGNQKPFSFTAYGDASKPSTQEYDKTITTTYIDTYTPTSATANIDKEKLYWYPSYFLNALTCSGRGDNTDKEMVINTWDDLEDVYDSLPSSYQTSFSNGTLDDPHLLDALMRYDYVVFYKNYGLDDFASRGGSTNRYYSKKEYRPFIVENDNTYIVVIIASLIAILSVTTLSILLVKKRGINKE